MAIRAQNIGFMWRHKEVAAHPGERARVQVVGSKGANGLKAA